MWNVRYAYMYSSPSIRSILAIGFFNHLYRVVGVFIVVIIIAHTFGRHFLHLRFNFSSFLSCPLSHVHVSVLLFLIGLHVFPFIRTHAFAMCNGDFCCAPFCRSLSHHLQIYHCNNFAACLPLLTELLVVSLHIIIIIIIIRFLFGYFFRSCIAICLDTIDIECETNTHTQYVALQMCVYFHM